MSETSEQLRRREERRDAAIHKLLNGNASELLHFVRDDVI